MGSTRWRMSGAVVTTAILVVLSVMGVEAAEWNWRREASLYTVEAHKHLDMDLVRATSATRECRRAQEAAVCLHGTHGRAHGDATYTDQTCMARVGLTDTRALSDRA
jgi:hypothetical protein